MEQIVKKLITNLSIDELEKIKSITGMVIMITKIIEKVHKNKNLSYGDSGRLTSLVIDVLVSSMKGRDINPHLNSLIFQLEQDKAIIELLVSETIDVWHSVSSLCKSFTCFTCCKKKKVPRIRKSIIKSSHTFLISAADSHKKKEEFLQSTYV
jgi:hypothetical protein